MLDKNYLIKKIINSEFRDIENKYLNFKIFEKSGEINIYFDKFTHNLIGWQTEDIYLDVLEYFPPIVRLPQP